MSRAKSQIGSTEFVWLMAVLMSLVALTIDSMLPALDQIGTSLGVQNPNDNQLVISTFFLGMAMGLMLYGPFSDSYGRKKAIYLGILIFIIGNLISIFSTDFTFMLVGRICQGFGAASSRVVTLAMIRDKFEGREMARVMSLIMVVFIMVPILAPSVGQLILIVAEWRAIFGFILLVGLIGVLWLHFRQSETLQIQNRIDFSVSTITAGIQETMRNPSARVYTIASGLTLGSFIGYLSSAQQILQIQYELGNLFSIYFGFLAFAFGFASYANSKLVMKFRMETLCMASLIVFSIISFCFFFYAQSFSGHPALNALLIYLAISFFCFGILYGNFNTLAVQHLGHIAGVATSVISSIQILLSAAIGGAIGQYYDGTVQPLVLGFLICSAATLTILIVIRKKEEKWNQDSSNRTKPSFSPK